MPWDDEDTKAAIEFDAWLDKQKEVYVYDEFGELFKELVDATK